MSHSSLNEHTHVKRRICLVCPNPAINKNMALHLDDNYFSICESILQSVSQDKDQRQALPSFVGSRWWFWCLHNKTNWIHRLKWKLTQIKTCKIVLLTQELIIMFIQRHHQACQASNVLEHWASSSVSSILLPAIHEKGYKLDYEVNFMFYITTNTNQ